MSADELDTGAIRALWESYEPGNEHKVGLHPKTILEVLGLIDEIDELRVLVAEAEHCTGCNGGEWTWQRRAEVAEAEVDRLRAAGGVQPAPAAEAIVEQILKLCHHHEGLIPPRSVKTSLLIGTIARMRREASAGSGSTDQPPAEVCDSHGQQLPCSECAAANGPSAAGSTDGAGTPTEWRQEICWTLMPAAFGDTGQRVCIRNLPCPDHGVTAGQGAIIGNLQAPIDRSAGSAGGTTPIAAHDYIATACIHDHHEMCRLECKYCATACRCACHKPKDNRSAGSAVTTPGAHACPYGCECPEHNPAGDPGCGLAHPHSRTDRCAGE